MDYLQRVINKAFYNFYKTDVKSNQLGICDIIGVSGYANEKIRRMQKKRLLDYISICKKDMVAACKFYNSEGIAKDYISQMINDLAKKITRWDMNTATKVSVLRDADDDLFLFTILMNTNAFRDLLTIRHGASDGRQSDIYSVYGIGEGCENYKNNI
jgi:predicted nucleic acid-binding protein